MRNRKTLFVLALAAFLLAGCIAVGDFVWLDENGNGIQDPGEPGIEGVTINLYDNNNSFVAGTSTDASGQYQLTANGAGTGLHHLEFVPPAGYIFTLQDQGSDDLLDSDVDPLTGLTASFTTDDNGTGFDAGLVEEEVEVLEETDTTETEEPGPEYTTVVGFVWVDANGNGIQDEGEQPLAEVSVDLFVEGFDGLSQQTMSNSLGQYQFDEVETGLIYYVRFEPSAEYVFTQMDAGDDDSVDSDADEQSGETDSFALALEGEVMDAGVYIPAASICYGPTAEDFPEGISPMSGLEVSDPIYLTYRPLFLSVSIFPASVRPPAIGVAPQIYVIYIGDGETRLMAGVYGEFPEANYDPSGEATGNESSSPEDASLVIGDRVWFDNNGNGLQDENEAGVPNIPVTLYINGSSFAQTVTDDFGNYYFDYTGVDEDANVQIFFDVFSIHPDFYFVTRDVGDDEEIDSDAGSLGYTYVFNLADGLLEDFDLRIDAGVRQSVEIEALRSGRIAYQDVQGHYCGCLVTAGADPSVAAQINICASAFGEGGIGSAGVDVTRLQAIAAQSTDADCGAADLAANLFCTDAPSNGQTATELWMEYSYFNISHFIYNGQSAYNWYINGTTEDTQQVFTLMTDGITGEPLTFENVVVMQVDHAQQNADGTIFTLDMDFTSGKAYYFRNGQLYEGTWTTLAGEGYNSNSGMLPPVRFLDESGNPFAFAPGQIWVNTVNVGDNVRPGDGAGVWEADFDAPAYSP